MNFNIALIRHGRTVANEKKLYCGWADLPLSKAGKREVKKNSGAYPKSEFYFTSGMRRCDETLKLIYGDDVPYEKIFGLKEINVGAFDMKSYEDLRYDTDYIKWITDRTGNVKCLGGESRNEFYARVRFSFLALTQKIIKMDMESYVCITHGGVIVAIMEQLFGKGSGMPSEDFYTWQPAPSGGYILNHTDNGYTEYSKIETADD